MTNNLPIGLVEPSLKKRRISFAMKIDERAFLGRFISKDSSKNGPIELRSSFVVSPQ